MTIIDDGIADTKSRRDARASARQAKVDAVINSPAYKVVWQGLQDLVAASEGRVIAAKRDIHTARLVDDAVCTIETNIENDEGFPLSISFDEAGRTTIPSWYYEDSMSKWHEESDDPRGEKYQALIQGEAAGETELRVIRDAATIYGYVIPKVEQEPTATDKFKHSAAGVLNSKPGRLATLLLILGLAGGCIVETVLSSKNMHEGEVRKSVAITDEFKSAHPYVGRAGNARLYLDGERQSGHGDNQGTGAVLCLIGAILLGDARRRLQGYGT